MAWPAALPRGGYGQQRSRPAARSSRRHGSYPPPPTQPRGYGQAPPSWRADRAATQRWPRATRRGRAGASPQSEAQSFFGALFDFGFNTFATPVVIKVLYILSLVGIGLGYVVAVISGFARTR